MKRSTLRKVTVLLPRALVRSATSATGLGLTPTIRRGLEAVSAGAAYDRLRRRRGQVTFSIDVSALREDRD